MFGSNALTITTGCYHTLKILYAKMNSPNKDGTVLQLNPGSELRFVLSAPMQKVTLQVLSGEAELFGSNLQLNEEYNYSYFFSGAFYSPCGCSLKLNSSSEECEYYIQTSNDVSKVKELYEYLHSYAIEKVINCPIILLTGPTDVGKSTLSRYLLNEYAKHDRKPIFVDLDVGQSSLSISGTYGVLPIEGLSDCHGYFNQKELSVYFFGYKSPGHNITLYKNLLHIVGRRLESRLLYGKIKYSGVFIDTCGWIDKQGYQLILEIIHCFNVNVILAIADHYFYKRLQSDLPELDVRSISALEGAAYRNKSVRHDNRNSSVFQYFYGHSSKPITPFVIKTNFDKLQIYTAKVKGTRNFRTIHYNSDIDLVPVEPGIVNQVLGLSYADKAEDILTSSVYGFICLLRLDMDEEIATYLSPHPGTLPAKYLLIGDITFTPSDN